MIVFQIAVFFASLFALLKSSDKFIDSAKSIGSYFSLPSFLIGVLIVGIGTSLPELASSFAAFWEESPEMIVANATGSNLANTLLIVGLLAILAKNIKVNKSLISLDIPLLLLSSALFFLLAMDMQISRAESIFLLSGLLYYIVYSISSKEIKDEESGKEKTDIKKDFLILIISLVFIIFSAKFLLSSLLQIGDFLSIPSASLAFFALAVGTSLPELFVSLSAVKKGHADLALGNIFGSNVFNLLAVVGIPAAFANLPIDKETYPLVFSSLALATLLFAFSGISKKIYAFEGIFFILIYVFVILKLFAFI